MIRSASQPLVTVIVVDYKVDNPLLLECLAGIYKQSYKKFETILLTDHPINPKVRYPRLYQKSYGRYVGPAQKRDDGVKLAKGEVVVFLDEDAYPHKTWLTQIVKHFADPQIAGVGGPGVTPPSSSWQEKASGWFSASPIGGGPYAHRFIPKKIMDVDDYPSMNLAVRKADLLKIGGFDSDFWPGEDTKLCLDLTHRLKKRIVYDPDAVVYHHRRPLLLPHLRQNGNFGIHRGYFARILPETSARPVYFAPTLMSIGFLYLVVYFFLVLRNPSLAGLVPLRASATLGLGVFLLYTALLCFNGLWIADKSKSTVQGFISIPVTFITHLWYGVRFLQGFLSPKAIANSNRPATDE